MAGGFELDRFLPYRLSALSSRVSREFSVIYRDMLGISNAEWRVLAHLSASGAVSVRDIHLRAGLEKSKASRAAARLEGTGLVEKKADERDGRLVALTLTEAGEAAMAELIPLARAYEAELLARLDAEDRAAFDRIVSRLGGP
ncbi:MarR family transcriptional regulator [Pikeienuella piscinae]|uniref:MarR family transcriptional regulator n=1 Tax=Pikeienuella piscinae TaxID=2748098 RepID=A0A7M3T5R3_9RHOB|nr:MarR family transcriptional regulator [Pikeienuella piscinae]